MAIWTQLGPVTFAEMTTAERDSDFNSPPSSLVIVNTDDARLQIFSEEEWEDFLAYLGSLSDRDVVVWNATTERWEPGALAHADLSDAPAIVQATEPTPRTGLLWLDTSTSGTGTETIALVSKTGAYTATDSDTVILCDASGGAFTITLPTAVGRAGKVFYIKKTDSSANGVTVDGDGSETIDGATTQLIATQYNAIKVVSDGSEYHIL